MKYEVYKTSFAKEIKQLIIDVFSESEGNEEGELIGNLAFELQDTTNSVDLFGFIARADQKIIGSIFFTRINFEHSINAFILSPVAIATEYQRQGIGQKLIKFGIEALKCHGVELLLTYGDPNFYSKVGFSHISESIIKAPLKLTYPHGWLAQSLVGDVVQPISGESRCVEALNNQKYW